MNTPEQNIIKTLKGKKVLFLENDNSLEHGLDEFERILKKANIEYKVLFDLSEKPLDEVKRAIDECDALVFQTRWVYEITKQLFTYVKGLTEKKIVVECYIKDPTWYYSSQHGTHHDVYIYTCFTHRGKAIDREHSEKFYKLSKKAYWDYKNEFDK